MEVTTVTEALREGLAYAFYIALGALCVLTFLVISANLNKVLLVYRDLLNQLGRNDKTLPPKVIACAGMAFFAGGLVLHEPAFIGVGVVALPLVIHSIYELKRVDPWEERERQKREEQRRRD